MKCLSLVVHESVRQNLVDTLEDFPKLSSFTITKIEGHFHDSLPGPFESVRDQVVGFVERIRVDILASEEVITEVLTTLKHCNSCVQGMGVYWVTRVEDYQTF